MEPTKKILAEYGMYFFTFIVLALLTLISVGLTNIRLAMPVMVGLILFIAIVQATIVLLYNMHLKFGQRILLIFAGVVFSMIFAILIVTMLDYIFR